MAQLYYRMHLHERPAQFEYFFRNYPDYGSQKAGYCVNAGLQWLLEWMRHSRFEGRHLQLLRAQQTRTGKPLFADDFLNWLGQNADFRRLSLRAIPEGRIVHPNVPLVVVQGPLAVAQILESALLNHLNYQTLVATRAARLRQAACSNLIIEFGLRRAQHKGANAGARAALIGGADFTSNTGISCLLGYPPKGTHAHSMVQLFIATGRGELAAFQAYSRLYPDDCLLLVDTINTLESGIPNAIETFRQFRKKGHKPVGIRLDSGDLAYLSIQAAKMLNNAGFEDTCILLSNQLDEMIIWQIITQIRKEAPTYGLNPNDLINRLAFGVGTSLITSGHCSALDGVYKLTAIRQDGNWTPTIKVSESTAKTLNPGLKHIYRIYDRRKKATADLLTLDTENILQQDRLLLHHPTEDASCRTIDRKNISKIEPLLVDILDQGRILHETPSIEQIRNRRNADLECLDSGVKRLTNPHIYHVSLSQKLWNLKQQLIKSGKK